MVQSRVCKWTARCVSEVDHVDLMMLQSWCSCSYTAPALISLQHRDSHVQRNAGVSRYGLYKDNNSVLKWSIVSSLYGHFLLNISGSKGN